jgi:flagellar motor switch protein FliN/FliY
MSKKLSQAEIDALVQRMLAGEPVDLEGQNDAGQQPAPVASEASAAAAPVSGTIDPSDVSALVASLVEANTSVAAGSSPPAVPPAAAESGPASSQADLGLITQQEVDSLLASAGKIHLTSAPVMPEVPPVAAVPDVAAVPGAAAVAAPQPGAPAPAQPSPAPVESAAGAGQEMGHLLAALGQGPMLDLLMDIELTLTAELVRTKLPLQRLLDLQLGSVIELDRLADEPLDILVGGVPLMKAKVVTIGEQYGVQVIESRLSRAS